MYKETHPMFEKHANEFFVVDVTIPIYVGLKHQSSEGYLGGSGDDRTHLTVLFAHNINLY